MKKYFVFLAVATLVTGIGFAQEKSSGKKAQDNSTHTKDQLAPATKTKQELKKSPSVKFSMSMLESSHIDPKYKGLQVPEVIVAIEKLTGIKKGEYQTSVDFNARKAAAFATKFLGGSSIEDIFAFVVPVPKLRLDGFGYEFNADNNDVNLYALPSSSKYFRLNGIGGPDYDMNAGEGKELDQFRLSTKLNSESKYRGSNAYGATMMVEKRERTRMGIAVTPIPFLRFHRQAVYTDPIEAGKFRLLNTQAAQELPNLKALIVMKLSAPYITYNLIHIAPKRDYPVDVSFKEKYLTGEVLGIVFYSGRTGEIFVRLPEAFGKPQVETGSEDKSSGQ